MRGVVSKIAKIYSSAMFESFQDKLLPDLKELVAIMSYNGKEVYNLLSSPLIQSSKRSEVITRVFKTRLSKEVFDLLLLLSERKRIKYIFEIYENYSAIIDEKNGFVSGGIKVPQKFSAEDEKLVLDIVSSILGKKAKIEFIKDDSMIAGFQGIADNKFLDYSVSGHLKQLEDKLK